MKLTLHAFLTVDGVMQSPADPAEDTSNDFHRGGWMNPHLDPDFQHIVDGWFSQADAFLLGRSTYDAMYGAWPKVTDPDNHVAAALNGQPKHVVSSTLADPSWHDTTVISTDVIGAVSALKDRPGRELQVHGSWQLARTLHDAGLVDEYRFLVFPVVVGSGKRLFTDGAAVSGLDLVDSAVTSAGVTYQALRPTEFTTGTVAIENGREVHTGTATARRPRGAKDEMVIIAGHELVAEAERDSTVAAYQELISRARAFDGCISAALTADPLDPRRINNLEVWRDSEALEAWRSQANAPESDVEPIEMQMQRYNATDGGPLF